MSLDYVRRGEAVKASTVNSLIEAVAGGGNQSPDLIVTGTPRGPQFAAPTQFGSTTFDKTMQYDQANYMLSGWPMTQLMLGTDEDMCLEGITVHKGKDAVHPISAAVVYKNSSMCPIDPNELTGYVLSAGSFAKDKALGASGWVKTQMEGVYAGKEVKMELWSIKPNMYQVFTNANDEDTKTGLSIALKDNNVPLSSLSCLQKDYSWTIRSQDALSVRVGADIKEVPTSIMSFNHGQKDVYETSDVDLKAVLKAQLVMYHSELSGENDIQYWTWLIPVDPDAQYDDETSALWTPQLTYGGNSILIEAGAQQLDASYDGEAAWIEDLRCIAYGKLSSQNQAEIEAGQLWLNLDYQYDKYAVVGTLSDEKSSESSFSSSGLPSNSIFMASAEPFAPQSDTAVMQSAPMGTITHGTFGDMYKDGPKLDSYTPLSSGSEMKSLNWAERGKEVSALVDCNCIQLYNFDKAELLDTTSADWLVGRRYDSETSSAEIVYLPPEVPDSSIGFAQTSSVQNRTVLTSDSNGNEVSAKVLQMYNFDNIDQCYSSMSAALEEGTQHIVLRNSTLSCVEYLSLSAIQELSSLSSAAPDADVPVAGLSSVQTYDIGGKKVLELYQFHEPNNVQTVYLSAQNRYDFVMRDQQTHQISYAHLSGIGSGGDVTLSGTDSSSHTGTAFKFQSAANSNISVTIDNTGVMTVGVYYI